MQARSAQNKGAEKGSLRDRHLGEGTVDCPFYYHKVSRGNDGKPITACKRDDGARKGGRRQNTGDHEKKRGMPPLVKNSKSATNARKEEKERTEMTSREPSQMTSGAAGRDGTASRGEGKNPQCSLMEPGKEKPGPNQRVARAG